MKEYRMTESDLQKEVIEYLKQNKIYYINIHGGGWTGKGTPDLILCFKGKFIAFELKVNSNTLSKAQQIRKMQIERAGGVVYTPQTFKEFKNIMVDIQNE